MVKFLNPQSFLWWRKIGLLRDGAKRADDLGRLLLLTWRTLWTLSWLQCHLFHWGSHHACHLLGIIFIGLELSNSPWSHLTWWPLWTLSWLQRHIFHWGYSCHCHHDHILLSGLCVGIIFISSLGGLFGLCLGFSVISFIEVTHHLLFFRNFVLILSPSFE